VKTKSTPFIILNERFANNSNYEFVVLTLLVASLIAIGSKVRGLKPDRVP
jgi:hypothetical protein